MHSNMACRLLLGLLLLLMSLGLSAQVQIGGNVYGGGNKGEVKGSTSVTVLNGDIGAAVDSLAERPMSPPRGKVFGGARMANVGGNTFVNIDGEHATGYIIINHVFAGNDIAGTIGTAAAVGEKVPAELTEIKKGIADANNLRKNAVDSTFNSYVRISTKTASAAVYYTAEEIAAAGENDAAYGKSIFDVKTPAVPALDAEKIYIGQLFGGGNGDFDVEETPDGNGKVTYTVYEKSDKYHSSPVVRKTVNEGEMAFTAPDLDKTYLEVVGGSIVFGYGGGNNATIKENTIIHIDNPSEVVNHIYVDPATDAEDRNATEENHAGLKDLLSEERFKEMGINTAPIIGSKPSSDEFQIGRFFGGNNKAEMAIMPTWNLLGGKIRNLYSGGNRGTMTSPAGLLLEIPTYSDLIVDYVYGGCRMADVMPLVNGEYTPCRNLTRANYPNLNLTKDYSFPNELSARVIINGGDINHVFGGNDITGTVYGGNAIGIYTTIRGDVYGGGNGAYPYTDLLDKDDEVFGDFSYTVTGQSTEALNAFRPNAEQVSIRLWGKGPNKDATVIKGSVFVGGNCATLITKKQNPLVELKIGSNVIADKVFLGNNGEGMVKPEILEQYAKDDFSSLSLTNAQTFSKYMEGAAMSLQPKIVFDNRHNGDPDDYEDYTSFIGSFYCGGNVGSMAIEGKNTYEVDRGLYIFQKFVGGCNNADISYQEGLNAAYEGGVIGSKEERENYTDGQGNIKDRLEINFKNLAIAPLRWNEDKTMLSWNTNKWDTEKEDYVEVPNNAVDEDTRLLGGNLYGGCYNSGHVNGNVIVNLNDTVLRKDDIFGSAIRPNGRPASGVDYNLQKDDVMAVALSVFGAGYGEDTEIWGSTTVNLNKGFAFQIFGGGEQGIVGKKNDNGEYVFDSRYSTTVNLNGSTAQLSETNDVENLAEAEYLYGGGNEGDVCGNTYVNLGNGRIYDAFGGACDADILGHTEVYIGRQPDGNGGYKDGFPWIRDIVYGGNDFGGTIYGGYELDYNFQNRLRNYATDVTQVHGYKAGEVPKVLRSSTYIEYLQGRVDTIFGGGYGYYNYKDTLLYGSDACMPVQHNSFVNIRPNTNENNIFKCVFGGGTGFPGNRNDDGAQDHSYVLIDIPDGIKKFANAEIFGSGSYNGLGTGVDKEDLENGTISYDEVSAIIDLLHGRIHNAYGGSYNEGVTRRTVVNVPPTSSIQIDNIFGGAYGTRILPPCDVYESQVNYNNTSENAQVFGAIYGGNNNERRSLFTQVNISSPVWSDKEKGYTGTVYGAGRGYNTWSEHTEVNLLSGAKVYNVFGGGEMGHVLNATSVQNYMQLFKNGPSPEIGAQDDYWNDDTKWNLDNAGNRVSIKDSYKNTWDISWTDAWKVGDYYIPDGTWTDYITNDDTNFGHINDRPELDDKTAAQLNGKKYNTNVIVKQGAVVEGYVYGGGLGNATVPLSGNIYGTTYVALLGGEVKKDIYAGGRSGGLDNLFGATGFANISDKFTATANAYIQGGTVRNVYGGGYEGHVGRHDGDVTASYSGDRPAESHVVIGRTDANTFADGAPAIMRNVYGGGEGGSVYGSSYITINNGHIGYRAVNTGTAEVPVYEYVAELDDQKPGDLDLSGNVFGGGYVINSYVDDTRIDMYGGTIRGSLYGGGEVGPIGRGSMKSDATGGIRNGDAHIYRAGTTQVNMYSGHVLRNVFGGGRGKDSWGGDGTMYMDQNLVATLDMKSKGYIFGKTEVNIYGGEIGTNEGMALNYGNVFGGCDEGSVYSAYMVGNELRVGKKDGVRYNEGLTPSDPSYNYQGYYYQWNPNLGSGGDFVTHNVGTEEAPKLERYFTEDCKVLVEPHCLVVAPVTIGGKNYAAGAYVPTADLNKLKDKTSDANYWVNLDATGIIIHNAVFAGGNIAPGSTSLFANTKTVYGNATASIHDIYNRDLITIGTGHTGGLYGDGNLTFVDGYRELNITNYGTDYYHIDHQLDYNAYKELPEREKAYYELKYKCLRACSDIEGTNYSVNAELPQDELLVLFTNTDGKSLLSGSDSILITVNGRKVPNPAIWKENGVVSVYAGRIMNTIQRADFCGVFGSRMVMKGAQDRVPEQVDYTNYTINRVREVSLNKMDSQANDTGENASHGNYFGIYSIVNYLGALTSDVDFHSVRTTKANLVQNPDLAADGTTTFSQWKETNKTNKKRNNGTCHNQVALASGVHLELTTEESTGTSLTEKVWGPITGVVELDIINVQPGMGGGFVYAKNQHGVRSASGAKTTTLTSLNDDAVTQWDWVYAEPDSARMEWQTSGNFIHSSQTIIDDCYNISGKYLSTDGVPAHYWFISGSVYVYDQYISAYTGAPNAYSKTVELPITINAASHGTMTLMDVRPNLYAYYSSYTNEQTKAKLGAEQKMVINNITYNLNDPITYWEWNKLTATEKKLFVEETYIVKDSCKIGDNYYPAGYVLLPDEYTTLKGLADIIDLTPGDDIDNKVKAIRKASVDAYGNPMVVSDKNDHDIYVAFDDIFRSSNNMSHDNGYLLVYKVNNPEVWNQWYTEINSPEGNKQQTPATGFEDGPTYRLKDRADVQNGILLGQRPYNVNDIIPQSIYQNYDGLEEGKKPVSGQATFVPAYLLTREYTANGKHYYPGAPTSESITGYTAPAYICTATIQLSPTEFIYVNDMMTEAQKTAYYNRFKDGTAADKAIAADINDLITPAYYCTEAGLYGGDYYEVGKNYRALAAWSSMSENDRAYFDYNYDALDLLIDPAYGKNVDGTQQAQGKKYQYDGLPYSFDVSTATADVRENMIYSLAKPIDYTATYYGTSDATPHNGITLTAGQEYSRQQYEQLPNEQRHYAAITVTPADVDQPVYVVKTDFVHVETPYSVGTTLDSDAYGRLSTTEKANITTLYFSSSDMERSASNDILPTTFYYCRESYQVNENDEGHDVVKVKGEGSSSYTNGEEVPVGFIISDDNYHQLTNRQKNFAIHGVSPMETSTLFVSRNSNIDDLTKEKVITVVYKYDYEESDADGTHITPISERHVVNIHVTFKSGVPTVPDIQEPGIVLPGTSVTMRTPTPTPGAYEILGGGWELFEKTSDAESHVNGIPYTPTVDSLYWYQDGFLLAYYAKTYLGKTYSNAVPVHVANYHDLKSVMDDRKHHLHVDYDNSQLKRNSKIYINNYTGDKDGIDLLKDFCDLSLLDNPATDGNGLIASGTFAGHKPLNTTADGVRAGQHLEFILRTDIQHRGSWTSIGSTPATCFEGTLHGDGHSVSGLDHSLFNHLCGSVYNLGVMGSFTGAGVAETGDGYVESCWVTTSGTTASGVRAVFGNPTKSAYEQTVNCYYPESNAYAAGKATAKPERAFYNGEVAYDLNNFYLFKRYSDHTAPGASATPYKYWQPGHTEPLTGRYASHAAHCSSGYNGIKYVEDRFLDGDFRYADGTIPTAEDQRHWTEMVTGNNGQPSPTDRYYPIWPDDYIFFGQKLTYGWAAEPHEPVPTAVTRHNGRLEQDEAGNRVFRAPAYYRSMAMSVAYFNADAHLAWRSADGTMTATERPMTAIDFAGHNDLHEPSGAAKPYQLGTVGRWHYAPLLDDDGLFDVENCDLSKNLMVYAPAAAAASGYANARTQSVLAGYFTDPVYNHYYDNTDGYRLVGEAPIADIHGHLVESHLVATTDHLLVDKQDFNCPIAYTFDSDHRMWYQRTPANHEYIGRSEGWQDISLPFTAELVTTHQKGEITHFYGGSTTSANATNTKIGHEYWLRSLQSLQAADQDIVGRFQYPDAVGVSKHYTNTFLWDYYYKNEDLHDQKDNNDDTYLQYRQYYKAARTYADYPLLTKGTPYILGLPGPLYYEFDLSGNFTALNTSKSIPSLERQTVSFVSSPGITVGVSDHEKIEIAETVGGNKYVYRPSYMNEEFVDGNNAYAMNASGNAYSKITTPTTVSAFRPYFIVTSAPNSSRPVTRSILFTSENENIEMPHDDTSASEMPGTLIVSTRRHTILVTSELKRIATVRIVNTAGITLSTFDIEPGKTIGTRVSNSGVYMVQSADGKFIKKVAVK